MDFETVSRILSICVGVVAFFWVRAIPKMRNGGVSPEQIVEQCASFALGSFFLELFFSLFLYASNTLHLLNIFVEQKTVHCMLGVPTGMFALFFATGQILFYISPKQR